MSALVGKSELCSKKYNYSLLSDVTYKFLARPNPKRGIRLGLELASVVIMATVEGLTSTGVSVPLLPKGTTKDHI